MRNILLLLLLCTVTVTCDTSFKGPTPKVDSVAPDIVCTAQTPQTIIISGEDFSPAVGDALSDHPSILLPKIYLVGGDGLTYLVPEETVTFTNGSPDQLEIVLPTDLVPVLEPGDPQSVYSIRVVNPNGNSDQLANALTVVPPPLIESVDPASAPTNSIVTITLTGLSFLEGMTVTLDSEPPVEASNVVVESPTTATAELDLTGVSIGICSITVDNGVGCSHTLENAFEVTAAQFFDLLGIDPPFGWTGAPTSVTILSDGGFVSTPTVEMKPADTLDAEPILMEKTAFVDANTLTAVVPAGLELGLYDVTVVNPPSDGRIGVLEDGFRVVSQPVPLIISVVPGGGTTQSDTSVAIHGENFRSPVTVELLDENLDVAATATGPSVTSENLIDCVFPTNTMVEGFYLVRVTNTDEDTYFTYSGFMVTNPSGNLHDFEGMETLSTGRRMPTGIFANDDLGSRYIYAIGGDTGEGGTVLDTVEFSQLSRFGSLAAWKEQRSTLNVPRVASSAISVPVFGESPFVPEKTYIYVLGGLSDTGEILTSVERAVVLSWADAPLIQTIETGPAGSLEPGTWYYKVSAVLESSDPDNPGGETLPSDEEIITLGTEGAVTLTWEPVEVNGTPAAYYRIYRTDEVNGTSQQEHLIADNIAATTYTDTGDAPGDESPQIPGATGFFVLDDTVLTTARLGHQCLFMDDDTDDRFVYCAGGKDSIAAGVLDTIEWASIDANGQMGTFETTGATVMNEPRAFFSAVVESSDNVSTFSEDGSRIWVMGGISTDLSPISTFEESDIVTGGGNSAWTTNGKTVQDAAGTMSTIARNKLFVLGGARNADDMTFGQIINTGNDGAFNENGDITGSVNSTAQSLLGPRALGVSVGGAGFIYFFGGTSDGSDALATAERTF